MYFLQTVQEFRKFLYNFLEVLETNFREIFGEILKILKIYQRMPEIFFIISSRNFRANRT